MCAVAVAHTHNNVEYITTASRRNAIIYTSKEVISGLLRESKLSYKGKFVCENLTLKLVYIIQEKILT